MLTNRYAIIMKADGKRCTPSPILFTDRLKYAVLAVYAFEATKHYPFIEYDFIKLDPVRHPDFDYFEGAVREAYCMADVYKILNV